MPGLGAVEIILIIVVIVLLFGARKLPDLARSVGRSMRIFKSEVTEMTNESKAREDSKPQAELTQGDDNDQFWQDPNMQPRQHPQQNNPQAGTPQQGYPQGNPQQGNPQQQQNWGLNQGGYPQQGNPQQQNWIDPQQGMQQPPQQNWAQQPGQQNYPGQQPDQGNFNSGNYGPGNYQQGNNYPQQPQQ